MGTTKSVPLIRQSSTTSRRQSEKSETASIKEPTPPVKAPPVVVPLVKKHTRRMELSERDIAFLSSQTGKNNGSGKNELIKFSFFYRLIIG